MTSSLPSLAGTKMQTWKKARREFAPLSYAPPYLPAHLPCLPARRWLARLSLSLSLFLSTTKHAHTTPPLATCPPHPTPLYSLYSLHTIIVPIITGTIMTRFRSSVAASSPNSLGSDAMDESDSEREEDAPVARDSDVLYPLEGKYRDLKDKAYIQGLSQLEREEILGQRAEEMSKAQFYAQVGQRAAQQNKKRKADSDGAEDSGPRRAVKPRVSANLEAYKQAREQRGQQRERQTDRRDNRRRSSTGSRRGDSEVDAEGESEVDYDERDRKPAAREELPANLTHFDAVRVGRGFFGTVCFYPGFEEAVTGA